MNLSNQHQALNKNHIYNQPTTLINEQTKKVFPLMMRELGMEAFNSTIWQQDGAKPRQANIVMD